MRFVSVSLQEQRLPQAWWKLKCGGPFVGKSLLSVATFGKQQSQRESVVTLAERETVRATKHITFDEGCLDSGRKLVVTQVMQGALSI